MGAIITGIVSILKSIQMNAGYVRIHRADGITLEPFSMRFFILTRLRVLRAEEKKERRRIGGLHTSVTPYPAATSLNAMVTMEYSCVGFVIGYIKSVTDSGVGNENGEDGDNHHRRHRPKAWNQKRMLCMNDQNRDSTYIPT